MYTTQLQAGLGLIDETKTLLALWQPGMTTPVLVQAALGSGQFPNRTARRLRNIVAECFAPRYLVDGGRPARHLKRLAGALPTAELLPLLLLHTCRANEVLADFLRQVYWDRYAAGYGDLGSEEARDFLARAMDDGWAVKRWSETTCRRVAGYLVGCCADYGLLEGGIRTRRKILPFRLTPLLAAYLAYDLHFAGAGDNALLDHPDWSLYGLDRKEVLEELKRLARKDFFIVQAAGDAVKIGWSHPTMEAAIDVLAG